MKTALAFLFCCASCFGQAISGNASLSGNFILGPKLVAPLAPLSVVQSKWSRGSSSPQAVTLSGVSAGNLIIIIATVTGDGAQTLASGNMSDGIASYTLDAATGFFYTYWKCGVYSRVASSSGDVTATLTPGGTASAINLCAYEVSGLALNAYDSGNTGTGSSATPATATFNTASAGVIVAIEGEYTGSTISHAAGANFTLSDSGNAHEDDNSGSFTSGMAEHRVTSGALTGTSAGATIDSNDWFIFAAAYK
jgi:hypothetical protein